MQLAYDAAHQALWERLYEVLKVASKNLQKMNSDDGRFRTEWYDNLQGLLSALPHLNIHNDPRIDEIKEEAEKLLTYSPDALTNNIHQRHQVAEEADKLFNKVSGIFGSFK